MQQSYDEMLKERLDKDKVGTEHTVPLKEKFNSELLDESSSEEDYEKVADDPADEWLKKYNYYAVSGDHRRDDRRLPVRQLWASRAAVGQDLRQAHRWVQRQQLRLLQVEVRHRQKNHESECGQTGEGARRGGSLSSVVWVRAVRGRLATAAAELGAAVRREDKVGLFVGVPVLKQDADWVLAQQPGLRPQALA